MASESAAAVEVPTGGDAPPATTEAVAKVPHQLERKWAFWCDNQSKPKQQGAAWGSSLRKLYTFDTVEEFWCLYDQVLKPSKLVVNADFHLFKAGVEPKWEDPECAGGGKWTITSNSNKKDGLEKMWLETLMALIGEQFDEADEICGVVASVRQRQDKLSLWTKTAANEAVQVLFFQFTVKLNAYIVLSCRAKCLPILYFQPVLYLYSM
ncbi:OLC1v1019592C3 [Oldenlandia corymbosa var. corymbosa]|uniref:Eukaryotic translation initiation factor isoform 4E n=1 Tax=Oldenlandia corymbosa var. corymbosa TaxID=529605 RepID=A0AAV1EEJ2_OLDCO|nr:OLC1v1019592C3 [Oldenlandia corymbosa var. corymbosa]